MNVTIKSQAIELQINTISIIPDGTDNLYLFHCEFCGNGIVQHQGRLAKITPVVEPFEVTKPIIVSGCRKCGSKFTFQTFDSFDWKKARQVRVQLLAQPSGKTYFFCPSGRGDPMLIYTADGIYSMVEQKLKTIPFISKCINAECPIEYSFTDLV